MVDSPGAAPWGISGANASTTPTAHVPSESSRTAPSLVSQLDAGLGRALQQPGRAVRVTLEPEGLGSVTLHVAVADSGVRVHIAVDKPSTRDLVEATWSQLSQACEQRGIAVDQVVVELMSQASAFGDAGFQRTPTRHESPMPRAVSRAPGPLAVGSQAEQSSGGPLEVALHRIDYRI